MNQARRTFLKSTGIAGAVAVAMFAGLLRTGKALAAEWNSAAFTAKTLDDAMKNSGYSGAVLSDDILIKVPEIAENGALVPVEATSNIPGTTSIAIFSDKNPNPLIAEFNFLNGAEPFISVRIKMAETAPVRIMVKADGKLYTNSRDVKVTAGGCGG